MTPKDPTNAARQKAWRDRQREAGPEVRGLYAPKEAHEAMKAAAMKAAAKHAKGKK